MTARAFISVLVALAVCSLCYDAAASGDTGTYKILDYTVKLAPKSDGRVEIAYYQKWRVTGGHIPWITVGTPNSRYSIVNGSAGGNAKRLSSANSGGWSGVRIDLDKDYKPDQTFEVRFTVIQSGILYGRQQKCVLDFVPGWYERAEIDRLAIEVACFTDLDDISADPDPTRTEGRTMTWERTNLRRGERFHIAVTFPRDIFDKGVAERSTRWQPQVSPSTTYEEWEDKPASGQDCGSGVAIAVIVVIVIVLVVLAAVARRAGLGGGDYDDGGGGGVFFSGFGGSRGSGCVTSCACACVSCACACACAGGGGAGCDRKLTHTCPLCRQCPKKDTCPLWTRT